jgi:hypothetical protein
VLAKVDVNLLTSSLKQEDITVGEWLNVIGYVNENREGNLQNLNLEPGKRIVDAPVQAIMVWSAGVVKLGEYEDAIQNRAEVISQSVK